MKNDLWYWDCTQLSSQLLSVIVHLYIFIPQLAIDKRLSELQAELLSLASSKADYEKVGNEIYHLRDEKQKLQLESAGRDEVKKRISNMSTFLQEQPPTLTEYDEPLVRRLIEKITIYEDKFTVEFKSGIMVDVNE